MLNKAPRRALYFSDISLHVLSRHVLFFHELSAIFCLSFRNIHNSVKIRGLFTRVFVSFFFWFAFTRLDGSSAGYHWSGNHVVLLIMQKEKYIKDKWNETGPGDFIK